MTSALGRRSWRELTHRRARAFFTIATIGAAVAALWMFAIPQLTNDAMADRVEQHLLDDVRLNPSRIGLTDSQIEQLRALPNVAGLDARGFLGSTVLFGQQRQEVLVVSVRDFADQHVNAVTIDGGAPPGASEVVVDTQNQRSGRLAAGVEDRIVLYSAAGQARAFTVSGEGGSLRYSDPVRDGNPVVYVPHETMQALLGSADFSRVEFRVADRSRLPATLEAVRSSLGEMAPGLAWETVADIRPEGDWPGRESMENVVQVFYVLAALAAASALFMVSNTMNAIVREQTDEIAVMKAIGGRRRQIAGSYVRSAVMVGVVGTVIGMGAGFVLSNLLLQLVATSFMTITPGWGASWQMIVLSLVVGVGGSAVASLPAVWRAVRIPVREALADPGIQAGFGAGRLDRALQRPGFLPRLTQMGLRNTARRKAASLAAALQAALALGIGIGLLTLAVTVLDAAEGWRSAEGGDIEVSDGAGMGFGDRIAQIEGVAAVEGVYYSTLGVEGERASMLGLPVDTEIFGKDIIEGRWFTAAEAGDRARVAVVGRPLAAVTGIGVGDRVEIETPLGPATLEVIGIDGNMINDGEVVYLPIETQYELDHRSVPNWYWVKTTSDDEAFIDSVAQTMGWRLPVGTYIELNYIDAAASRSEERLILGIIATLGIPIAAIGMIGLASSMTMSVLERTREIGILRSIGARARDVRRIIRAEGLALALVGWMLSIPLGAAIGWAMLWLIGEAFHNSFGFVFPYWAVPPALVVALAMAAFIVRRPARRAIRLSPGSALRYE